MFRFRLAVVIVVSFSFVLFLGNVLYWGADQVTVYFQRSQRAYDIFDRYERLSLEAYRYFKERMDRLIIDSPESKVELAISKQRLYGAMNELRNIVVNPPVTANPGQQWFNQFAELEKVARFTAFLESSEYFFDEVEQIHQNGERNKALQMLSNYSETEIDRKFQPLIDAAIEDQRVIAGAAKRELEKLVTQSHRLAILVSSLAALFSLTSGILLLRGMSKPIEALLLGTDEITAGNLHHRIRLHSRDEFAYLADHFNRMAQELARQQQNLRENRLLLEKKVDQRTSELYQLNNELQRIDKARRQLLADISHELRTPITVIRGEAEVTLGEQAQDIGVYQDTLQRIVDLTIQLGKYVNDLLNAARSDITTLHFDWDFLNLSELIANTLDDVQVMADENSISVSLQADYNPIWVKGDSQRLRQVLFILGDNACRYSNPGGRIEITVWTDGIDAKFSFSDQGIGIPNEDLGHIFERKFRSQNAIDLRQDGSGLGLSMAKAIVNAHGGQIGVTSTINSGSTFTVSLPLIATEQEKFEDEHGNA